MHTIDRRIGLLFGAFLVLLAIAGSRAAWLGVFSSRSLGSFGNSQAVVTEKTQPVRGEITDRSGQVLALSESDDAIIADPEIIQHPDRVAALIAPLMGMNRQKVLAAITKPDSGYVVVASDVPSANATKIMHLTIDGQPLNGINDKGDEKRVYPLGTTAAQVLGWVNAAGAGAAGVEYTLNTDLKGRAGKTRTINDGEQQAIGVDTVKPVKNGDQVALTLSVPLQQEAEKTLQSMVATYGGTAATAIVVDPQTSQILADANYPSMNANHGSTTPLADTTDQSVDLSYEPGSTFKAITIAAGLMDGTITPNTMINEPSCLPIPYTVPASCISDAESHGDVTYSVSHILQISSNIGADLIAQMDGPEHGAIRLNYWMHRFGFGRPTGVALNGESYGVILPLSQYSGATMYNLPFGQGQEVTPMQMVQFYDAIADGGVLRRPQIIYSLNGKRIREPAGTRIMSTKVASEMRIMMRGVVADGGTASGAQIQGYDLAGKTGTAQVVVHGKYSDSLYNASFIGMVPAKDPKLLVYVLDMDVNNGYGGTVAGEAFQKIVGWAVPHFGIDPCAGTCPKSAYASATPNTL
jgi:cell division protein FtsI (penicillin-binding protein 3)